MGVVRLVRGDVDHLVVVAYMWPEPCCVSDRERNRRLWLSLDNITSNAPGRSILLLLLGANGHAGLQMVQPKVWRPVSSDALGLRFPKRFLLEKHFKRLRSTPMSDVTMVPFVSVLHHCVHVHMLTTFVRLTQFNSRCFSFVGIKTPAHGCSRSP